MRVSVIVPVKDDPARLRAALCANDRLKLYLSVLQAAAAHAHAPHQALLDLAREIAAEPEFSEHFESIAPAIRALSSSLVKSPLPPASESGRSWIWSPVVLMISISK